MSSFAWIKAEIQEAVDQDYNSWLETYQPKRSAGIKGLKAAEKAGESHSWTTIDEFVQDYFTLSDGQELSYVAVGITTGIQEGDLFFTSDTSWEAEGEEDRVVNIELVFTCPACQGNASDCIECDQSGEWVILPKAWVV
jgi:hypothetical protein